MGGDQIVFETQILMTDAILIATVDMCDACQAVAVACAVYFGRKLCFVLVNCISFSPWHGALNMRN